MEQLVVLVRHAEREFAPGVLDAEQVLTPKGEQTAERLAVRLGEKLAEEDRTISVIATSPFVRAETTARGLLAGLRMQPPIERWDALAPEPEGSVAQTLAQLKTSLDSGIDTILIVGHKPDLADLSQYICGEDVQLRKAEAAALQITTLDPTPRGTLEWTLYYK